MVKYLKRILGIDDIKYRLTRIEKFLWTHNDLDQADKEHIKRASERYDKIERDKKLRRRG